MKNVLRLPILILIFRGITGTLFTNTYFKSTVQTMFACSELTLRIKTNLSFANSEKYLDCPRKRSTHWSKTGAEIPNATILQKKYSPSLSTLSKRNYPPIFLYMQAEC